VLFTTRPHNSARLVHYQRARTAGANVNAQKVDVESPSAEAR